MMPNDTPVTFLKVPLLSWLLQDAKVQHMVLATAVIFIFARSVYRVRFHPLAHIPGPLIAKITSCYDNYILFRGDECTVIARLHEQYGPIVRVTPNHVDIADADALHPIYTEKGGFLKGPSYQNFDIGNHATIFSERSPAIRAPKAKTVMNLFSTTTLKSKVELMTSFVDATLDRIMEDRRPGQLLCLKQYMRALGTEISTVTTMGAAYGKLNDASRAPLDVFMEQAMVGVAFQWFPNWAYNMVCKAWLTCFASPLLQSESQAVESWLEEQVQSSDKTSSTFQSQLLELGLQPNQVAMECMDLAIGGTDTLGINMAMTLWQLACHPNVRTKLKASLDEATLRQQDRLSDAYLLAIVRETLRCTLSSPNRFPRVVPPGGWTFKGTFLPAGTIVGCSAYQMHLDPNVFPEPRRWHPDRWLNATNAMYRNFMPYGVGARICIAQNLANMQMALLVLRAMDKGLLEGARTEHDTLEMLQWSLARVKGGRVGIRWDGESRAKRKDM